MVIKGVEWFVPNVPPNMHVLHLFITPREMARYCQAAGLHRIRFRGLRPRLNRAFWRLLWTRVVPEDFEFTFTSSLLTGYLVTAEKA